jgi:hypothetical protein
MRPRKRLRKVKIAVARKVAARKVRIAAKMLRPMVHRKHLNALPKTVATGTAREVV